MIASDTDFSQYKPDVPFEHVGHPTQKPLAVIIRQENLIKENELLRERRGKLTSLFKG